MAGICGARVAVVANLGEANAFAVLARVRRRAGVAVVAGAIDRRTAALTGHASIGCARIIVVAGQSRADALDPLAHVIVGASVAIVAGADLLGKATGTILATICCTRISVIANHRGTGATATRADVAGGAGVGIIAGGTVRIDTNTLAGGATICCASILVIAVGIALAGRHATSDRRKHTLAGQGVAAVRGARNLVITNYCYS